MAAQTDNADLKPIGIDPAINEAGPTIAIRIPLI